MLRFTLFTCLIAFVAVSQVFAQQMEDVVYLEDGGVVRGTIVEQIPGESLKIQTRDGNVFVFTMDEITKLAKEMPKVPKEPVMGKVEIGTLLALRHSSSRWASGTYIQVPSVLSIWLIPREHVAIGSEIGFESRDGAFALLLGGQAAFFPVSNQHSSTYVLGTGSLQKVRHYDIDISVGIGMGLRARTGSAFVLRMEGRYERWFEDEVNDFSFIIGLGTRLGGCW